MYIFLIVGLSVIEAGLIKIYKFNYTVTSYLFSTYIELR